MNLSKVIFVYNRFYEKIPGAAAGFPVILFLPGSSAVTPATGGQITNGHELLSCQLPGTEDPGQDHRTLVGPRSL
jgi:hypothetical protein